MSVPLQSERDPVAAGSAAELVLRGLVPLRWLAAAGQLCALAVEAGGVSMMDIREHCIRVGVRWLPRERDAESRKATGPTTRCRACIKIGDWRAVDPRPLRTALAAHFPPGHVLWSQDGFNHFARLAAARTQASAQRATTPAPGGHADASVEVPASLMGQRRLPGFD